MMKFLVSVLLLAAFVNLAYGEMKCSVQIPKIPEEWIDLKGNCLAHMKAQIQKEIDASYTYLAMGAYFSRDTVNRPNFADLFFKAAKEEREHGSKLIEYLSMRGELTDRVTDLIKPTSVTQHSWKSGVEALEAALLLEHSVTKSIRNMVKMCENEKQYHLVDYLTGVYLEEQLHGQRDLAGKLTTLKKMMDNHGALGEFLFDKNL